MVPNIPHQFYPTQTESVMTDMVDHPPHYNAGTVECIEAIRSALSDGEFRGYIKGNIIKYVWRERYKGGNEDIHKAIWYLNTLIAAERE